MTALSIDTILAAANRLPKMPMVIMDLISAFADDDLDNETLAQKLSHDQGLVARVLRVANSPFYGLPRQIGTVQDAITVLGFANVRTLVTAAAIIAQFPRVSHAAFDLTAFWKHSIGVACCAKVLSVRAGHNPNTAFICGLLHDIGRVLLACSYPAHYAQIAAHRKSADCAWLDAERAVIGIDHAAIGAALAARWNFPEQIQQAVADHHQPDNQPDTSLAALTHVSDAICYALDTGHDPAVFVPVLSAPAWAAMRLGWDDLNRVFSEIELMIEGISVLAGTAHEGGAEVPKPAGNRCIKTVAVAK